MGRGKKMAAGSGKVVGVVSTNKGEGDEKKRVERILKKRFGVGGRTEYFLKWVGEEKSTWERTDNLDCPAALIDDFERVWALEMVNRRTRSGNVASVKTKESKKGVNKASGSTSTTLESRDNAGQTTGVPTGFDRGLDPDKIIGATESSGELMFMMRWKGNATCESEMVPAKEANVRCPQAVISFYEERLTWSPTNLGGGDTD